MKLHEERDTKKFFQGKHLPNICVRNSLIKTNELADVYQLDENKMLTRSINEYIKYKTNV